MIKQLGLKKLFLISVILLVGLSVSVTSLVDYINQRSEIMDLVTRHNQRHVLEKAQLIENYFSEKIKGVAALGRTYRDKVFPGHSAQDYIDLAKTFANALNTGSSFIGFESNGAAYWNLENDAWPNHKFKGDIRQASYYKDGRRAITPTVTNPYPDEGDPNVYWISIVQKTKSGVLGVDMKLSFLNQLVKKAADVSGSMALIFSENSTVLASDSSSVRVGQKGEDIPWLKSAVMKALGQKNATVEYQQNGERYLLFSHQIDVAGKQWYFAIGLNQTAIYTQLNRAKHMTVVIGLIATLMSVLVAYFVIQLLYRPIRVLKETIAGLSSGNGDLTQRLTVTSKDELGEIAQSVNAFIAHLQRMMQDIRNISGVLQQSVEQLKAQSEQNASVFHNHVAETEQVVTAISEMSATAESMATDTANTATLTQKAQETGLTSSQTMAGAKASVSALIEHMDVSAANVKKMDDETQGIKEILTVIGGIAEQTNLLALNAAIEAARAGDQGRGFAVVADEVRNLASRTKDSTVEIETLLTKLTTESQGMVNAMNQTRQHCDTTAADSEQVATSLDNMTQYVSEINMLNTQIATAAQEQSSVTQELNRNMVAINEIVAELDENGRQALDSVDDVASMHQKLVGIVEQFKL
jgi:methyl-accepting chemotaxis protein